MATRSARKTTKKAPARKAAAPAAPDEPRPIVIERGLLIRFLWTIVSGYVIFVTLSIGAGYYAYHVGKLDSAANSSTLTSLGDVSATMSANQVAGHDATLKACKTEFDARQNALQRRTLLAANDAALEQAFSKSNVLVSKLFGVRAQTEERALAQTESELKSACDFNFTTPVRR